MDGICTNRQYCRVETICIRHCLDRKGRSYCSYAWPYDIIAIAYRSSYSTIWSCRSIEYDSIADSSSIRLLHHRERWSCTIYSHRDVVERVPSMIGTFEISSKHIHTIILSRKCDYAIASDQHISRESGSWSYKCPVYRSSCTRYDLWWEECPWAILLSSCRDYCHPVKEYCPCDIIVYSKIDCCIALCIEMMRKIEWYSRSYENYYYIENISPHISLLLVKVEKL